VPTDPADPGRVPIVTLTTDFGLRDPWVGVMKGVILGICPRARLVDLTHEVPAHDIVAGQLALEAAVPYFPTGTVHLAVVDPGVGSRRRPIAIEAGGRLFVGPDNGLFTFVLSGGAWSAVVLESPDARLPRVSTTFHGRDVFAPAAARLACGVPVARLGPPLDDPVRRPLPAARRDGARLVGEVIAADRFGNLVTSVRAGDLDELEGTGPLEVSVDGRSVGPPRAAYAAGEPERPAAIMGSSERLEIFVREGSASAALGARRGAPVVVSRRGGA
jgi:S-adenosylmethionine hydrolase